MGTRFLRPKTVRTPKDCLKRLVARASACTTASAGGFVVQRRPGDLRLFRRDLQNPHPDQRQNRHREKQRPESEMIHHEPDPRR